MAENITVTLVLDDSQYKGKLAAAGNDAASFGSKVAQASTTSQANFDKLTSAADRLKGAMLGLTTVILGAGILEFGRRALQVADDISDLSKGTEVSIARILQLQQAFAANGGQAEGLGRILSKLSNYLYEARDGSQAAQESLFALGFSLNDIGNLNTDQSIQKIIEKLAGMQDPIERNALAFRTLGKEARNIDWAGLAAGTTTVSAENYKLATSIVKAEEANQRLEDSTKKLQLAFIELIDRTGILDFITSMSTNFSKFQAIVEIAGAAFAVYFGASAVLLAVEFALAIGKITKGIELLFIAMKLVETGTAVGRILNIALGLGAIAATFFGIKKVNEELDKMGGRKGQGGQAAQPAAAPTQVQVAPYWEKEIAGIKEISAAYSKVNEQVIRKINLETQNLGLTTEEIKANQALADFDLNYKKQLIDIDQKITQARAATNNANKTGQEAIINALILQKVKVTELNETERKQAQEAIQANAEKARAIDQFIKAYDQQISMANKLAALQDDFNKTYLTETEKKYYDIATANKKLAEEQILAETKASGIITDLITGEQKYRGISEERKASIVKGYTEQAMRELDTARQSERVAKDFGVNWGKAFRSYVEAANDAGAAALRLFDKTMSGMEDLIVNFVKTGKFQWKDFVASMAEEVLRSNVKQLLASLFNPGSATQSAGPLGGFGKLLGALVGGNKRDGSSQGSALYVIPAELGGIAGSAIGGSSGGFMDTVKGIFGGVADAVSGIFGGSSAPSTASGGGIGGGFLGDVIGGISDFFGGFFAGGGSLGAGKFGIAGERGPELIRGPASITPIMGGGSVTYNINAVDAMSFKALIAQDPGFIHAVAQQGAQGIAGRR